MPHPHTRQATLALPQHLEAIVHDAIADKNLKPHLHDIRRAAISGWSIKRTAATLGLAENSVRACRAKLCDKFGVTRVAALVSLLLLGARRTA